MVHIKFSSPIDKFHTIITQSEFVPQLGQRIFSRKLEYEVTKVCLIPTEVEGTYIPQLSVECICGIPNTYILSDGTYSKEIIKAYFK